VLVKLENKPIQFRRDAKEYLPYDVNDFALVRINGARPTRAGREEKAAVVRRKDEAYRDALFRRGYR
jgi:hypothetical protein